MELRARAMAEYFPETEKILSHPGSELLVAKITDANTAAFRTDFDRLLDQRAAIFKLPARAFRQWLKTKNKHALPYPELDPLYLEQVFKPGKGTLEDLQNAYFLAFAQETKKGNLAEFWQRLHPKELGRLSLTLAKGTAKGTGNIIKGALVAGPVAGVFVAFFSAPLRPVQESSEQVSNILFADVAQSIQTFMGKQVHRLAAPIAELKTVTHALDVYNFEGMDRNEAKKIMDGFEERYYKIFLRIGGLMPNYKRSGRDNIRDWAILQPMQLASNASTFNMEFTMNQALLAGLKEKIGERAPSAAEKEQLAQYEENMNTAENRLAVALASWKLYRFMFAEVSREPQTRDASTVLTNTLERYEKYMNMDKYRKELSGKIREAFHNFDPTFNGLEKINGEKR
jgi:hypothetical protein